MFDAIFEDNTLTDYINENINDPWVDTPFEGYVFLSPKQKGEFGERFVQKYFENKGSLVERAPGSTDGFDRYIDHAKIEIKFSLATRNRKTGSTNDDTFIINHVSRDKDWEYLVFFGINRNKESRLVWFTKEDFVKHHREFFSLQQGGQKIDNDDFMCTNVKKLLDQPWVHDIADW